MTRQLLIAFLLAAAPMTVPAAAFAGQDHPGQAAREAPQGQVPLSRVLGMLAKQHKGKQLNTVMGEAAGRPAYLVQWQLTNGRIVMFTVDAQTGQVVGQQGG